MGIFLSVLFFSVGTFFLYFSFYSKVKQKNKDLTDELIKVKDQKNKIASKYRSELEKTKEEHIKDIEKRKFQYEEKRREFAKYFTLLDSFHSKSNELCIDKIQPIIMGLLSEDKAVQRKTMRKYSEDTQATVFELNEEHRKVKAEQNSIRLMASEKIDELLDKLDIEVELATQASSAMIKVLTTKEFWTDQSIIKPYQSELFERGQEVQKIHKALKEQMKLELDEI